jgi:hypothetical protein
MICSIDSKIFSYCWLFRIAGFFVLLALTQCRFAYWVEGWLAERVVGMAALYMLVDAHRLYVGTSMNETKKPQK